MLKFLFTPWFSIFEFCALFFIVVIMYGGHWVVGLLLTVVLIVTQVGVTMKLEKQKSVKEKLNV